MQRVQMTSHASLTDVRLQHTCASAQTNERLTDMIKDADEIGNNIIRPMATLKWQQHPTNGDDYAATASSNQWRLLCSNNIRPTSLRVCVCACVLVWLCFSNTSVQCAPDITYNPRVDIGLEPYISIASSNTECRGTHNNVHRRRRRSCQRVALAKCSSC